MHFRLQIPSAYPKGLSKDQHPRPRKTNHGTFFKHGEKLRQEEQQEQRRTPESAQRREQTGEEREIFQGQPWGSQGSIKCDWGRVSCYSGGV